MVSVRGMGVAVITSWCGIVPVASALSRPSLGRIDASQRVWVARAARDYIEGNLTLPLRLEELAQAVGVGVRSVQRAFRDVFGSSPYRYVQSSRLRLARTRLLGAEPGSTNVTRVAHECGFDHLGRFAVDYRSMFGESPSVTLSGTSR